MPTKKTTKRKATTKKTVKRATKKATSVKSKQPRQSSEATTKQAPKKEPTESNSSKLWQDPEKFSNYLKDVGEYNQEIFNDIVEKQIKYNKKPSSPQTDPLNLTSTMQDMFWSFMTEPQNIMRTQQSLWEDYAKLFESFTAQVKGDEIKPVIEPVRGDRRFSHAAWNENQTLNYLKQSYLLLSKYARKMVEDAPEMDDQAKKKALFYTDQFLAALSPTNFPSTNPEVIEETIASKGENFLRGYKNFLEDLERGDGELAMKQADLDFFEVGKNIATTPGKVVFENDLIQLIQYTPTTEKVHERPLLIFPPWINKYYILDLQPENSLISWLVEQGRTVFVVSWVNPDQSLSDKTFSDYMFDGAYAAVDAVEQASGVKGCDTIGYCIGGTLLAVTLGHMAQNNDNRIKSATFFTAQMDFVEAGDLLLFVDDEQISSIEAQIDASGGIFKASTMSKTFNMLRPIDLIWSVYIDNYLLGKDAKRFDLLYWNSDSTNMPKNVYLYYLKEFYLHNKLSKGLLEIDGTPIDLSKVTCPIFMQAGEKDHIAPPSSIYRSAQLYGGDVTYMLAGSGHIAGVINHPDKQKYHYRTNEDLPEHMDDWVEGAERHDYSWWPYWSKWLDKQSTKKKVKARRPGSGALAAIEDAPGRYVKVKA